MKTALVLLTGAQAKLGNTMAEKVAEVEQPSCLLETQGKPKTSKPWDEKVSTFEIKQFTNDDGEVGKLTDLQAGNDGVAVAKIKYLKEVAYEFRQAAEAATGKAQKGVLMWVEEVLNFSCPEEAERACEADHAFERFAKIAHRQSPELEIIRLKVPIYAMAETGKYALMDPYDLLAAETEDVSEGQGKAFPRLGYIRTGCNKDKKSHGRLFVTYDDYGEALTSDDPKTKTDVAAFVHTRDRRGLCAGDDDPSIPVNGCCAR